MAQKTNDEFTRASEKLDIIIGLLLELKGALTDDSLIKNKVSYLSKRSLNNKEISRALGISEKYVSKEKSILNKNKGEQDG